MPEETAAPSATATEPAPKPVTAKALADRFPKSTAEWRLKCLENGYSMSQCIESHAEVQEARAAAAEEQLAAEKAKNNRPGVKPVATGGKRPRSMDDEDPEDDEDADADIEEGDATATWQHEFAKALKSTNGDRVKALKITNRKNPGLRQSMLQEQNALAGRPYQRR